MRQIFSIPGPPQGKGRPKVTTRGGQARAYTPPKTAQYEALIRQTYQLSFPRQKPLNGPIELILRAYMPIPKSWSEKEKQKALCGLKQPTVKPDLDNIAKTMDALNGIAWEDDKQIVSLQVTKQYGVFPRLEVEIWQT